MLDFEKQIDERIERLQPWDDVYELEFTHRDSDEIEILAFRNKEEALNAFNLHKNDPISKEMYESIYFTHNGTPILNHFMYKE